MNDLRDDMEIETIFSELRFVWSFVCVCVCLRVYVFVFVCVFDYFRIIALNKCSFDGNLGVRSKFELYFRGESKSKTF